MRVLLVVCSLGWQHIAHTAPDHAPLQAGKELRGRVHLEGCVLTQQAQETMVDSQSHAHTLRRTSAVPPPIPAQPRNPPCRFPAPSHRAQSSADSSPFDACGKSREHSSSPRAKGYTTNRDTPSPARAACRQISSHQVSWHRIAISFNGEEPFATDPHTNKKAVVSGNLR